MGVFLPLSSNPRISPVVTWFWNQAPESHKLQASNAKVGALSFLNKSAPGTSSKARIDHLHHAILTGGFTLWNSGVQTERDLRPYLPKVQRRLIVAVKPLLTCENPDSSWIQSLEIHKPLNCLLRSKRRDRNTRLKQLWSKSGLRGRKVTSSTDLADKYIYKVYKRFIYSVLILVHPGVHPKVWPRCSGLDHLHRVLLILSCLTLRGPELSFFTGVHAIDLLQTQRIWSSCVRTIWRIGTVNIWNKTRMSHSHSQCSDDIRSKPWSSHR